jgi:thiosulfate reductase cytochrome b subunit
MIAPQARYEHPYVVRFCHWLSAISLSVMIGSGIEIFRAFPSFGAKIPQHDLVEVPSWLAFGGWLGGALQLHLIFMWLFAGSGVLYVIYQIWSRNYRQVLSCAPMCAESGQCFVTTFSSDQSRE